MTAAEARPAAGRRAGATRWRAVVVVLILAAAALAAGVPDWIHAAGATALQGHVPVAVTGTQAAPGVPAAALVLLAAAAAAGLVGRFGRWAVVVVVAGSGVLLAASALAVIADPGPVARSAVAEATGITALAGPVTLTAAPYAVAALGVAGVLVAGWLALRSRTWARPSPRHEPGAAPPAAVPDDDQSAWDALSRGNDPS